MAHGHVVAICIADKAGAPLQSVGEVQAIEGRDLEGDRYLGGEGSFNKGRKGKRQVTLINALFFRGTTFEYCESRRNIVTLGIELMDLIGKEFDIGEARMRGIKYCDPCVRPSRLSGKKEIFKDAFHDRGGLVAEVVRSGIIRVGSQVIPPRKDY